LDLYVRSNDYKHNGLPPYLSFEETERVPFLGGGNSKYFCGIVRFTVRTTYNRPLFIHAVKLINNNTKQIAGWRFPHTKPYVNLGNDLTKFRVPVAQLQQEAGVQYAFPVGAVEVAPGAEWKVDFGALTNAKRAKCGKNAD
jgi:hypothetical protein